MVVEFGGGDGGIPPLPAHAHAVDTRHLFLRLDSRLPATLIQLPLMHDCDTVTLHSRHHFLDKHAYKTVC